MSERKQGPYAADDFAEIRKHLDRVQERAYIQQATPISEPSGGPAPKYVYIDHSKCAIQDGRPTEVSSCWCYHSAPDGSSYMCPHRGFDDGA